MFKQLNKIVNGGYFLIVAAILGLFLANLPSFEIFTYLAHLPLPLPFNINLNLESGVEEGLLTVFFFNVGLDLKHEFIFGPFNNPKRAGLPVIAALGGVIVPAIIFLSVVVLTGQNSLIQGWAISSVTDIALSLSVLSFAINYLVKNPKILTNLQNNKVNLQGNVMRLKINKIRTWLMTIAVADDIFGIIIIALFYSRTVNLINLLFCLTSLLIWAAGTRFDSSAKWVLLIPCALFAWYFMLKSGIHTAILGVLLGLTVSTKKQVNNWKSQIVKYRDLTFLISGLVVLPIYIFFKMRINFWQIYNNILYSQNSKEIIFVMLAIILGLVLGKPLGIILFTFLANKFTAFSLPKDITIKHIIGIGFLAGIGFTVSLLIADLSFISTIIVSASYLAVIVGSVISGIIGYLFFVKKLNTE
ncbi:MAG: Na+/H+ antiporter NhaA [Bifidobacteriaceae bacterium]|jgi:NhaA family Na+:H+ antiporter|nr:Na+/H+ antiporter NhaA [Bifidobacteriaceae bacterium]